MFCFHSTAAMYGTIQGRGEKRFELDEVMAVRKERHVDEDTKVHMHDQEARLIEDLKAVRVI